ncbi:hypothetical protein EI94DRAFT_1751521 [Lactarius quietus]|nr:hypothetical protein EI94DRAFT_1751521 [Lactarius quietus]
MPILCEFEHGKTTLTSLPWNPLLDIGKFFNIRVSSTLQYITIVRLTTASPPVIRHRVSTMTSPHSCIRHRTWRSGIPPGEHTHNLWMNPNDPPSVRISFELVVFFNGIDLDKNHTWRLKTTATNIDANGFTLHIGTWLDTILYSARVGWIAYPEDREHIFSTSVSTPQLEHTKEISFNSVEFLKTPSVFIALNSLDIDCKAPLRIHAHVDGISTTRLVWHIDSWADTVVYSAGATIIAFN